MESRGRLHWLEEHKERAGHAREPVTASTTQPRCDNAGAFLHNAVEPMLVAVRTAPPVALGVGVIDLTSAALTIWALAGETQADQAKV